MTKRTKITAIFIAIAISTATPALAKTSNHDDVLNAKSPLTSLYSCTKITDPTERLACYDKKVSSLKIAEDKKEIVAIDANVARKIKREAFGFNLPSMPKLGLPKIGTQSKQDELVVKVKSIRKRARKYIIILENGQVWQESGGHINYIPKGELTATIKPKSMGSYLLSLNNGKTTVRGLRIKRIE